MLDMKKLAVYQTASKSLEVRKEKLEKSKTSAKLAKEVEEAEKRIEESRSEFNNISDICKEELLRFENQKAIEIKKKFSPNLLKQISILEFKFSINGRVFLNTDLSANPEDSNDL